MTNKKEEKQTRTVLLSEGMQGIDPKTCEIVQACTMSASSLAPGGDIKIRRGGKEVVNETERRR